MKYADSQEHAFRGHRIDKVVVVDEGESGVEYLRISHYCNCVPEKKKSDWLPSLFFVV